MLNLGKDSNNVCLHFNPRFDIHGDINTIVCNSKDGGAWGTEQRESVFPFQPGSVAEVGWGPGDWVCLVARDLGPPLLIPFPPHLLCHLPLLTSEASAMKWGCCQGSWRKGLWEGLWPAVHDWLH